MKREITRPNHCLPLSNHPLCPCLMQFTQLLSDDEAVSPVIGVILMVAITVILAAVIASFVLGIGDQQEVQPSATFDWEYDSSEGEVTITHESGSTVQNSTVVLRGDGMTDGASTPTSLNERFWYYDTGDTHSDISDSEYNGHLGGAPDDNGGIEAGDSVTIPVDTDAWDIRLVWQSSGGGQTATLTQESGPGA